MSPHGMRGLGWGITDRMRTCLACRPIVERSPEVTAVDQREDQVLDLEPREPRVSRWRGWRHIAGCLRRDRVRAQRAAESRLHLERCTVPHGPGTSADRRA